MCNIEMERLEDEWNEYWIPTIIDAEVESGDFEKELKSLKIKSQIKI